MHRKFTSAAFLAISLLVGTAARAEMSEINIAQQYGIGYLPLMLMEEQKLVEKHAKAAGIDVKVSWAKFAGGNVMNDALLSGSLQFASGGVGPLVTLWARTRGNLDVRGVAAINSMPLYLNTRNPNVKTLKDFTDKDKIALPAVKVSIQAVTLQMAAEKAFGPGQHGKLDPLTVTMSHPDAQIALLSGQSEITAHFSSPPFQYQQLEKPYIHTVLNSYDVLGGPATFNTVWTTAKFRNENPKLYDAFVKALDEATAQINQNKRAAAEAYLRISKDKDSLDNILRMLNDPAIVFTTTPQNVMKYVAFMYKIGSIKAMPDSWKDLFFPNAQGLPGELMASLPQRRDAVLLPDLSAIRAAQTRIAAHVHRTPVLTCAAIDAEVGGRLYFKCENFQKVGAFKARGACNAVFSLSDAEARRGVLTHSSGNHGAALAYAAQRRGIRAYVVMPDNAPEVKQENVRRFGAIVRLCAATVAAREATCAEVQRETGATLIHPFDDPQVIAGQGTAVLELLDAVPDLDAVIAPCGGGGLLSGTAIAVKSTAPRIGVFGAEPRNAGDAAAGFRSGKVEPLPATVTIADGLRTTLSPRTLDAIRANVTDVATCSEENIVRAMRMTFERMKIVIEPSSAVPLACLLEGTLDVAGKRAGVVLSGGNVDLDRLPWHAR